MGPAARTRYASTHHSGLMSLAGVRLFPCLTRAQSVCDSRVVFVGRAEPPVTFHVSGEAEIEKARKQAVLAEEEFERLQTSRGGWMRATHG